jgi:hypothetical protein
MTTIISREGHLSDSFFPAISGIAHVDFIGDNFTHPFVNEKCIKTPLKFPTCYNPEIPVISSQRLSSSPPNFFTWESLGLDGGGVTCTPVENTG